MKLDEIGDEPVHLADCCAGISRPLLQALAEHLPPSPALILSVGCGSGLLENLLLETTRSVRLEEINLYGVEVPSCANKYLPDERLLRVPTTTSLHPDAMLASALIFVYPREADLIGQYLDASMGGALETVLWLGHRSDWHDVEQVLLAKSHSLKIIDGRGLPDSEVLAIATIHADAYKNSSMTSRIGERLTDEQLDIWEHAALLYHGYEWQAAADTFIQLAIDIQSPDEKAICLLNAGLIQARLGDFDLADASLEEAAKWDRGSPITTFFIAMVSYELGDTAKAEACLQLCLDGLTYGGIDYNDVGLDFALDRSLVHENLSRLRNARFSAEYKNSGDVTFYFDALPAEYIFKPPPRSEDAEVASEPRPNRESKLRKLVHRGKSSIVRTAPSARSIHQNAASPQGSTKSVSTSSPLSEYYAGLPQSLHGSDCASDSTGPSSPERQEVFASSAFENKTKRTTWHRRPTTPYVPRDARIQDNSTRDLAKFIRSDPKNAVNILVPKDARGEREPLTEVTQFIDLYSPDSMRSTMIQPFNLDPRVVVDLRLGNVLDRHHGVSKALMSPQSEYSVQQDIAVEKDGIELTSPVTTLSSHSLENDLDAAIAESVESAEQDVPSRPPSEPASPKPAPQLSVVALKLLPAPLALPPKLKQTQEPKLDLLPATVYKPPTKRKQSPSRVEVSEQSQTPPSRANEATTDMLSVPPTSPSSVSSYSPSRKAAERQLTLQALEGDIPIVNKPITRLFEDPAKVSTNRRVMDRQHPLKASDADSGSVRKGDKRAFEEFKNKPLPPNPSPLRREKTPDTAATENFFERVLGPAKKSWR